MNIYAWIGIIGAFVITATTLIPESGRTKKNIQEVIKITAILLLIIILTTLLHVPFIGAFLIGALLYIVFDRKTYTRKRLIIYGSIVIALVIVFFILFRHNPSYTLKHIEKNPESTSLYVTKNDEETVSYESDVTRPLASVVKIMVAMEYAYQIDDETLAKDELVSIDEVERYYIEGSDGGAHTNWLETMEDEIKDDQVELHNVAQGMIEFSSNANTDYLIDLLGVENINNRINEFGLTDHDDVHPLVGALLMSHDYKKEKSDSDWEAELRDLSNEEYKNLAITYSEKMKNEEIALDDLTDLSRDEQRIWSDRLPSASAATYGDILNRIQHDDLPETVAEIMHDLMKWPENRVEAYKDYETAEAKGGSTAFILNQAMHVETDDGDQLKIVLLMDDLPFWKGFMLRNHAFSFVNEMVEDQDFLADVKDKLSE